MSINISTNADCKCGHKPNKHRQFSAANYCIGDDYLCKSRRMEEIWGGSKWFADV